MISLNPEASALLGIESAASPLDPVISRSGMPAYEGASQTSSELALFTPELRSADADILPEMAISNARTRDIMRNDAYVQGAATLHRDTIVGSNYMLTCQPNSTLLFGKEDTKWEDEFSEEVEGRFQLWADGPDHWIDASRINNFTSLVRLGVGIYVPAGEILATVEWRRDIDALRPFNTAIQMVDLDRLSTPPQYLADPMVRAGIRRDAYGAPQGYYIRNAHSRDYRMNYSNPADAYEWTYSPIRKPWGRMQVIHIFEQQRAEQTRGLAAMVSALKEMKQTKRFRDIVIQNAVLNATYAASIESELPTDAIFARLGAGQMDGEGMQEAINGYIGGYFSEIAKYLGGSKGLTLDGVKIPHLPPGSKLELRPAGQGGPLGSDFESSLLRHISASLGVSYEELAHDFTKTNYSGFKGAVAQTQRGMNAKKKFTADRFASIIFRCWFEEAFNKNTFETLKRRKKLNLYEGQNFDILTQAEWIGASFGQIDELKETQAAVLRMNAGLSTMADEAARLGKDWRRLLRQLAREKEWKDFYKVLQVAPDSQNMMNATSDASNAGGQNTKQDQ